MSLNAAELKAKAASHGQGHLFNFFDTLNGEQQKTLLVEINAVEFDVVERLVNEFVKGSGPKESRRLAAGQSDSHSD